MSDAERSDARALTTVVLPDIKATSFVGWLRSALYLPEVLYLIILVWLFFAGAGRFSVDFLVASAVPVACNAVI